MIYRSLPNKDSNRERQGFSAVDISLPSSHMNVSEITLTERYPEKGHALNQTSEMIVRILEGATVFQCEDEEVFLSKDSTVLVPIHKKYRWIPEKTVTLLVVSSPPWTIGQHQNISE